jgi:hypothetical protein
LGQHRRDEQSKHRDDEQTHHQSEKLIRVHL